MTARRNEGFGRNRCLNPLPLARLEDNLRLHSGKPKPRRREHPSRRNHAAQKISPRSAYGLHSSILVLSKNYSVHPSRYSRRMNTSASGQPMALSFLASQVSFFPVRSATLQSNAASVSAPE